MKTAILLGLILATHSAHADVICQDIHGQTLAIVQGEKLIVSLTQKNKETLNIQVTAADGRFIVADAREQQKHPASGGQIAKSTLLLFAAETGAEGSDQAILQYAGNSYILLCK